MTTPAGGREAFAPPSSCSYELALAINLGLFFFEEHSLQSTNCRNCIQGAVA
jgi:hypothetical protein